MKKNVSSQSMDATLQDFLGNKRVWKHRSPSPACRHKGTAGKGKRGCTGKVK